MSAKSERPRDTVEIDVEKSPIKMTLPRLIAVIATVIVLTNMGSNAITAMASDDDVKTAVDTHTKHPHPVTEKRLAAGEVKNAAQDAKLAKLESVPEQLADVNGKLDMIILRELDQPGRSRDAMQRAARKVRSKARVRPGSPNDPLSGIPGLD